MILNSKSYDFFISYAGPDTGCAETLADALRPVGQIFIEPHSVLLGDDWPTRLAMAIQNTWVTLVIVSKNTEDAHFQMQEILLAVKEAQAGFHAVIPLLLAISEDQIPIPLLSKHHHDLNSGSQDEIGLVVDRLLEARDNIRSRAEFKWRKQTQSPELSPNDPLRRELERLKALERAGLIRERVAEDFQPVLLRHYMIRDERDTDNPTR